MTSFRDRVRRGDIHRARRRNGSSNREIDVREIKSKYGRVESLMTRWHKMDLLPDVRLAV